MKNKDVIDQIPLEIKKEIKKLNAAEEKREKRYRKKFQPIPDGQTAIEKYIPDNKNEKFDI